MPAKKGPIITGRKLPGKPGEGRGKKKPMPIKPGPKGGKNPKLPYRFPDGKQPMPKLPKPKKDGVKKPAGGNIRDLLYRAKPGEMKKPFQGKITQSKYDQMIQSGKISMMRRPDLDKNNKLQDMLKGYRSAPDNSKVTYKTRVKPDGLQRMTDAPYRIKKATVKTGRGR